MENEFSTLPVHDAQVRVERPESWCLSWIYPSEVEHTTRLSSGPWPRVIGRASESDVRLFSPSVSRAHAELRLEGNHILLRDLGSRNGIVVNGSRVPQRLLRNGDLIRIGDCLGLVQEDAVMDPEPSSLVAVGFHARGLMRATLAPVRRLATGDLPIVIQGETGTGKERTARAIHEWSGRSGEFIAINCAALPERLAEAELFGYRRGAFSGAERNSPGHFRSAEGGTLFLDEVAELSAALQAKLLRALDLREVLPLGESRAVPIDVRVLSATREHLSRAVELGKFRIDLHARLDGFSVELPPLRERIAELPALFTYLLQDKAGCSPPSIDPRLIEALCLYQWPGNVRELQMAVRRLLGLRGHEARLQVEHLDEVLPRAVAGEPGVERPLATVEGTSSLSRDEADLSLLLGALRQTNGNLARAASLSCISRQRAYRLLQTAPGFDLTSYRSQVP